MPPPHPTPQPPPRLPPLTRVQQVRPAVAEAMSNERLTGRGTIEVGGGGARERWGEGAQERRKDRQVSRPPSAVEMRIEAQRDEMG